MVMLVLLTREAAKDATIPLWQVALVTFLNQMVNTIELAPPRK